MYYNIVCLYLYKNLYIDIGRKELTAILYNLLTAKLHRH